MRALQTMVDNAVLAAVKARPDPSGLPGSTQLEKLVNGLMFWALLGCLAGLVVSAGVWAMASNSGNYHHAGAGKKGVLFAAVGALLVGAAPAIINFFEAAGGGVK